MSVYNNVTPGKVQTKLVRLLAWGTIVRDYHAARDDLTQRIHQTLQKPWLRYLGSKPESGNYSGYSSLQYESAETAQQIFSLNPHDLVYARNGTPAGAQLVDVLKQLDLAAVAGGVTQNGMGAVHASLAGLKAGDHIVASKFLFAGCRNIVQELQDKCHIDVTFVDGTQLGEWEKAVKPNTKAFFFEPLGNPGMELVDIAGVAQIAHTNGRDILVIADSSMTPLDQALSLGADVAVLSTTKFLGNGVDNGGAVLLSQAGIDRERRQILKDIPPDDTNAINEALKHQSILRRVANHGLTQAHIVSGNMLKRAPYSVLRFKRQTQSAQILADHISHDYGGKAKILSPTLSDHPQAQLSALQMKGSPVFSIQFETQQQAFTFINALIDSGISTVNNFGSPRTTTANPASTTHSSLSAEMQSRQGLTPGLVRISVGIENADYLKNAFDQAMEKVFAATAPQFDALAASTPTSHL